MTDVPHFAYPFRFVSSADGGVHASVNEQDSIDDITDCVTAILNTPLGYRTELPEFGLQDMTFNERGIDIEEIQVAISQWEPRADIILEEDESALAKLISKARVFPSVKPIFPNSDVFEETS